MDYVLDRFVREVETAIRSTQKVPEALIELQTPRANILADLAFPVFRAARALGLVPSALAQELVSSVQRAPDTLVGTVAASGPFLNFTFDPARLARAVIIEILTYGDRYGHDDRGAGATIVIDYSSPNVAKRMHVGHIRSTIIGQALVHIFRALGYHVIGDNHLGDWGKQFGVLLAAIKRYGRPEAHTEEQLGQLEALYARYSAEMQIRPELDDEARRCSLLLEQGDAEARALWQWCVETTLAANQRNYDRLGVQFDHTLGESFYEPLLAGVIQDALDSGVAYRDPGGAVVVEPADQGLPTFLLQRSDGGTLYQTRDLATIKYRQETFAPTKIIYVVEQRQELHFRQLFAAARAMRYVPPDVDLVHVPFGTIFGTDGQPLSTRKGNMVYLQALLDDAVARARTIVEQKNPDLSAAEKDRVAEAIGIGAVIYNDLYQDPRRNITLDWERMLSVEGNSAAYLQYSYARCRSILRRAVQDADTDVAQAEQEFQLSEEQCLELLTHPAEQHLIKHLARLPEATREAGTRYAPFVIADWCYTTAREFSVFFEQCSVLKAETSALRTARLALVAATAQALKNGLHLLGITTPERM